MQACNVILPTPVIFSCNFDVIISDRELKNALKVNAREIAHNFVWNVQKSFAAPSRMG